MDEIAMPFGKNALVKQHVEKHGQSLIAEGVFPSEKGIDPRFEVPLL